MSLRSLRGHDTSRGKRYGSFLAFVCAMVLLGFLTQFQWAGYVLIAGWTIAVFARDLPARTTYIIALFTLSMVPIGIILSNWTVAQNFAAYTFVLLVVGVLVTTINLRSAPQPNE